MTVRTSLSAMGSLTAIALAPVMVVIKYQTGWDIIPEPWWISFSRLDHALARLGPPTALWRWCGTVYTLSLLALLLGLVSHRASCCAAVAGRPS